MIEMDISKRVADDLRIKNVFFATAGKASAILYAEFHSEEEAFIVKQNARKLTTVNGHRSKLVTYIPRSLFKRYKAVEEVAFNIRSSNRENATRVWVGEDFELRVRKKVDKTPWSLIQPMVLNNLPEQEPRITKQLSDLMDVRRPLTPKTWETPQIVHSGFESENIYNLLQGVEDC